MVTLLLAAALAVAAGPSQPRGARPCRRADRHRHRQRRRPTGRRPGARARNRAWNDDRRRGQVRAGRKLPSGTYGWPSPGSAMLRRPTGHRRRRGRDPRRGDARLGGRAAGGPGDGHPERHHRAHVAPADERPGPRQPAGRAGAVARRDDQRTRRRAQHQRRPGDREAGHPGPELEPRARARQRPADRDPGLGRRALAQHRDRGRRADRGDPGAGQRALRLRRARRRGQRGAGATCRTRSAAPALPRARCRSPYSTNNQQPDGTARLEGATGGLGFRASVTGRTSDDFRTPVGDVFNTGNRAVAGTARSATGASWGSCAPTSPTATRSRSSTTTRRRRRSSGSATLAPASAPTSRSGPSRLEVITGFERNRRREFEEAGRRRGGVWACSPPATRATCGSTTRRSAGSAASSGSQAFFDDFTVSGADQHLIPSNRHGTSGCTPSSSSTSGGGRSPSAAATTIATWT